MKTLLPFFLAMALAGCIADQQGRQQQTAEPPVIVNVPTPAPQDLSEVRKGIADLAASSNNTASQMSGLLNASVSKIAEQVKGVEANVESLAKLTATMNNTATVSATASAEIKSRIDSTIAATNEMKAELSSVMTLSSKIESAITANVSLLNDLKLSVGKIEGSINANANAQVGFNNSFQQKLQRVEETTTTQANRDVNMFPATALYAVLGCGALFVFVIVALAVIVARALLAREQKKTDTSEGERKQHQGALMRALALMPERQALGLTKELRIDAQEAEHGAEHEDKEPAP